MKLKKKMEVTKEVNSEVVCGMEIKKIGDFDVTEVENNAKIFLDAFGKCVLKTEFALNDVAILAPNFLVASFAVRFKFEEKKLELLKSVKNERPLCLWKQNGRTYFITEAFVLSFISKLYCQIIVNSNIHFLLPSQYFYWTDKIQGRRKNDSLH